MAYSKEKHAREQRIWRRNNPERSRAIHQRAWSKLTRDPAFRTKHCEGVVAWRKANREKHRAQWTIQNGLKLGTIHRPARCQMCGKKPKRKRDGRSGIEAHHPDCAKPLQVIWVCSPCHSEFRRKPV